MQKEDLRGHVDRVDPFLIAGWALSPSDPSVRPEVRIMQGGEIVVALRPNFPAPRVRSVLGLSQSNAPPLYGWRLWFPLSNGLKPEVPFSIVFAGDGRPLALGNDRKIELMSRIDPDASHELTSETLVFPSVELIGDRIKVWVRVAAPPMSDPPARLALQLNKTEEIFVTRTDEPFLFKKLMYAGSFDFAIEDLFAGSQRAASIALHQTTSNAHQDFHNSLRTLYIPRSLCDRSYARAPVPDVENIHRVSGPTSNANHYLVGGLTTFLQLNAMTSKYFGRAITDFPVVVDWGAGCARVMRHFFESADSIGPSTRSNQRVIGLDIDEKNIDWCRSHMNGLGHYETLGFEGFDLETSSVDLLYGISVVTHLSEFHQHLWLSEIARVLKPGGCAILTTHGEFVVYGEYLSSSMVGIFHPFVDKFGFFDGIPDAALGTNLDTYYRASYHSRGYIKANWKRYLEIVDFVAAANAFRQDFVVLRKRPTR
jgi:SAM-dependent methyltransferase